MSYSITETYTTVDVENVVRKLKTDLIMIADSTGAITRSKAADYASDFEILAKAGYLKFVDIALFDSSIEKRAVRYTVDEEAGDLIASKPGGVLWPRVTHPYLQITIDYTKDFNNLSKEEEQKVRKKLTINWTPSNADISHSSLASTGGRSYVSNAYGVSRKDYSS